MCERKNKILSLKELNYKHELADEPDVVVRNEFAHGAISHIHGCGNKCIVFPELIQSYDLNTIVNKPFIYDFNGNWEKNICELNFNGINPYRITDSTNISCDGTFYLLCLNFDVVESLKYFDVDGSFRFIIKAHYCKNNNSIKFLKRYDIPNDENDTGTPNFEAIVQIAKNEFIIASDDNSRRNGQAIIHAKICGCNIVTTTLKLAIHKNTLSDTEFDNLAISGAFNSKCGIIFVLQNPETMIYSMLSISHKNLTNIRKHINCGCCKCSEYTLYADCVPLTVDSSDNPNDDNIKGFEAMTSDKCNNLYAIREWIDSSEKSYSRLLVGEIKY